jgi:hypothetical protein
MSLPRGNESACVDVNMTLSDNEKHLTFPPAIHGMAITINFKQTNHPEE